ncbi:hypothetical protein [Dyella sp.]|uniref:hypothetical protein n=1 Tax=Dyella sp. TaxID=1869338 RepID=UPI002ED3EC7D
MSDWLRRPSTYLGLPMLLACGLTLLTYDFPPGYMEGMVLLCAIALAAMLGDAVLRTRLPDAGRFRQRRYAGTRESFVALAFAIAVALFCLCDVTLFPVPLLGDPSTYATMTDGREHVRHVSDMCWALPVIGLLCARQRWLRNVLIVVGVAFPILVIDRNRLFASLIALGMVIVLRRDPARALPWKTVTALGVAAATLFAILGIVRTGSLEYVALPFSDVYKASPVGIKWLLLYVSAGPYNFSAILAKHYENAAFLVNQLVPMAGSVATAGTDIPLDAPNINVGTEFFPFLMAWGPYGAAASFFVLYALLLWSVRRLRGVALFPLLIFLRVAYVCLMAPFAPQAFTWTNGGFLVLCLLMQVLAAWLPNRRGAAAATRLPRPAA